MGEQMSDADRGLLELISATFEPVMAALDAVDLADLPLEPDLDPGRAPRATDDSAPRATDDSAPRATDDSAPRATDDSAPRATESGS